MADANSTPEVSTDDSPTPAGSSPDVTQAAEPVQVSADEPSKDAAPVEEDKPKRRTSAKQKAAEPKAEPKEEATTAAVSSEDDSADEAFELTLPTQALQVRIQRALGRHGRYYGPANGVFDERALKGVQATLPAHSSESADGVITEKDAKAIQRYAKKHGSYAGPVNGQLDSNSWTGFALGLERSK